VTVFATGIDEDGRRVQTALPEERYALAFVFRVFNRVARTPWSSNPPNPSSSATRQGIRD
jgi:hypothetical protein